MLKTLGLIPCTAIFIVVAMMDRRDLIRPTVDVGKHVKELIQ
jgi:hypothetical protein